MNRGYDRIRLWSSLAAAIVALAVWQQSAAARGDQTDPHPLDPALMMARHSLQQSRANIQDYTAVLVKRLRINGGLKKQQYIFVKIRNRKAEYGRLTTPMAVYLRFLKPDSLRGREVIWVEGQNNGKLVAHDTGFKNFIRVKLDPTGFIAMREQRYPLTDIGIENLIVKLIETGERDRNYKECDVKLFKNAKVNQRVCTVIQVIHPVKRPHFEFYRARVYFDDELNIPIRYASWSWPDETDDQPPLEEEYTYTSVNVNVGLTDRDFDPDNTEYNFP